ncbi:hypothetical protein AHAS_Ahas17G0020400 [Arachis hypogaea]
MALESLVIGHKVFLTGCSRLPYIAHYNRTKRVPIRVVSTKDRYPSCPLVSNCFDPCSFGSFFMVSSYTKDDRRLFGRASLRCLASSGNDCFQEKNAVSKVNLNFVKGLMKSGVILAAAVCGVLVFGCPRVSAVEGVVNAGYGVIGQSILLLRNTWPKVLQVLRIFKEQGLILAILLGLSAFFSMAETSITTLWPWKVRELAEKESENGVFRLLRSDVTRFLTTILIGTTVVNIAATALVTDAATAMFGEAGVSAATGVMTVAILLLTEITPKSIAVHNATEVARFVVRPVAWLSLVLYPVGRVVTYLSMGMLKMLGLKGRSEPYVTEEELKLMLRGAELSGAIEEEEQDMIENVLEIKDTHVREVMTPLVDVVAIDGSLSLVDFHHLWVTHQYSRVPVFEQRVDNITGIAYAMDLLDYVKKGDLLESTTVGDMAHKPAYFVPDSMSVWNLLREFRIRKVHMAVVLNEYGGTVGIVTLEDVVEEIVGEIFDENDSKEEIQKKTGYIVMRAEGVFDVDANTSIDQLSEDLNIKMPEGHQYETVSGFVCETFGYIPRTGESIKVSLEREDEDDDNEETKSDNQDSKEKNQIFKLEILAGNARKVSAVRFERINGEDEMLEAKEVTHFVPKIVKRKWNNGEDSDDADYDGDAFAKRPQHEISSESIWHVLVPFLQHHVRWEVPSKPVSVEPNQYQAMGSLLLLQFQIILCLHLFFTSFSSSSSLSPPLCHPDQNSALLQLKNSLKVDGWENGTDCCSWPGVTCESTSGHVIGLDLSWRGLEGKINSTSSLFHLTHLQKINLAQNGFYGPLLPSQFGGFVNLTHLNLSWCSFEGDIPSEISYLSKLVSLDLSGNLNLKWTEITWKRLLQNATALREIFLDYTDMSSISLSSLSLITNWSFSSVTLGLSNTNITGYLTSDILCLPNLKELHLYGNTYLQVHVSRLNCNASVSILDLSFCEFQGSLIPSSFSNLTYLTSLTLFDCGLNGSIPSSLSNLQHLTHLDLSSNSIVGSIPSSFSNLQHLTYLDLSNNNLTGAVPASFSKLELLTHLDLSSNELNGSIPSSLWKLQDLVVLDLSYNELSGQLPDIFGGLNKLQTLNLGKNKIQGKLPFSLFTLTQLSILYFSSNKFEGPLPNQIAGFSNLTELYLDDNLLNGTIPSWCLSLPLLKHLNLSSNQFTGNLSEISSYSLLYLNLCGNKIHGDIPQSIFDLVNLTELCLSSDNHGGFVNFPLFSKLQNLRSLTLSGYESISLKSDVNANYTFSNLKMLHLFSNTILDFPKFSGKFPRLLILDLSNNNLQGEMPKWIHDLDSLYHLNLSTNQLTSIENFSWHGLQYLDLSSNLMTNEISSILCNISSLEVVDLSNNYFTGTIPQCLSNLSYLEVLDLRMNKLYGTLPDTFSMNSNLKTLNLY